jgi:hypothetical protein
MSVSREDVQLLIQFDQVYKPDTAAKKFIWSELFTSVVEEGTFFDRFALDSDERFHVNEIATYYELMGTLWRRGVLDEDLIREWAPAALYWNKVGPVLVQAREVFDIPGLWADFEDLARAQREA